MQCHSISQPIWGPRLMQQRIMHHPAATTRPTSHQQTPMNHNPTNSRGLHAYPCTPVVKPPSSPPSPVQPNTGRSTAPCCRCRCPNTRRSTSHQQPLLRLRRGTIPMTAAPNCHRSSGTGSSIMSHRCRFVYLHPTELKVQAISNIRQAPKAAARLHGGRGALGGPCCEDGVSCAVAVTVGPRADLGGHQAADRGARATAGWLLGLWSW